jgi:hypothetical protein
MKDFEVFLPTFQSSTLDHVMEMLSQLHPSGRILFHFRIALDSSAAISKELDLGQLILASTFKGHKLSFQYWPQDILI